MNIIQNAIANHNVVNGLPGEQVFMAVEEFLDRATVLADNELKGARVFLSLEDGSSSVHQGSSLTLALEELTGSVVAIIVAIGVAVAALIYKLYKHFFGNKDGAASVHDKVEHFSTEIEKGIPDVAALVDASQDARYTVQDPQKKKELQSKIDQKLDTFEKEHTANVKFAIIADNKNGKKFITYYKNLSEIMVKLNPSLLQLEAQVDRGVDLIKTIASLNTDDASKNESMNALLTKETQTLEDRLDIYSVMADSHKLESSITILTEYKSSLEKNGVPSNFFVNLNNKDAKSFITGIMRQEAINMHELVKRLEDSKDTMDVLIKLTKKYEGLDKEFAKVSITSPAMTKYFNVLRRGMNTVRTHAKAMLTVAKAEDLLYNAAQDCCAKIIQYTADIASIADSFAQEDNRNEIKEAKSKTASFFKRLTGRK